MTDYQRRKTKKGGKLSEYTKKCAGADMHTHKERDKFM